MKGPIRVLHVVNSMGMGGTENFIMNVYRKIDRSKVQFDFAVHTQEKAYFDEEIKALGGRIFSFPKFNGKNIVAYTRTWNKFLKDHPELSVVHGHMGSSAAIYLNQANKYHRLSIAHSHSVNEKKWTSPREIAWEIFSYPTRYVANHCFACGLEAGKSRYGKKFVLGSQKNQIINNGIDIEKFVFHPEIRNSVKKDFKISEATYVIGSVGRFEYPKNHKFILEIFSAFQKINSDSELWLVGDGELKKEIENRAKELNLEEKVRFLGIRNDVNRLMMAFDTLLMPSHYEGLPLTMIEGQAAGLKEVVSDVIDTKADVTGNVQFLPLSASADDWAREIWQQKNIFPDRKNAVDAVIKAGYSIEEIANNLQKFYLNVK